MSKYSIINGEEIKKEFEDFNLKEIISEGEILSVNKKFIAAVWEGGASCGISIFDKFNPIHVPPKIPLILAHRGDIQDIQWSPYVENLLFSASQDGTVKLWQIPNDGLKQTTDKEKSIYKEHNKKVKFMKFHPCSSELIASCDSGNTIKVWNPDTNKTYTYMTANNAVENIDWNYNGSLLGCMSKDKYAYIFDLRAQKEVAKSKAFDSLISQKVCFVKGEGYIVSGTEKGEKKVNLYDLRNPDSAVSTIVLDNQPSVMYPFYDYDINCLYVPAKGNKNIHFVTVTEGKLKILHKKYTFPNDPSFFTFEKKRFVDLDMNEMTRMYRYRSKKLNMTSIKIPRKTNVFDPELYPDTFCGESALTGEEWISGVDKEPIKKPISQFGTQDVTVKNLVIDESRPLESLSLGEQLKILQDENEQLRKNLSKENEREEKLKKEIEKLKAKLP